MIEVAQADIWQKRACVMTIPLPNTYQLSAQQKKSTLKKFLDFCGTLKKIFLFVDANYKNANLPFMTFLCGVFTTIWMGIRVKSIACAAMYLHCENRVAG